MCIIVDTNVFSNVFDSTSKEHIEFKPVKDWIFEGNGMLVFGGSTFEREIFVPKYRRLIIQLLIAGKAKRISTKDVDEHQIKVAKIIPDEEFDDKHLAALVRTCECKLICTKDTRSIPYLKDLRLYKKRSESPKFYTSKKNRDLLVTANIADCCKPSQKTTNAQKEQMRNL
jgi:hypothetical protein